MICLDLNVLADFGLGICREFQLNPCRPILDFASIFRETGLTLDDFFNRVDNSPGFWSGLPIQPGALSVFELMEEVDPDWKLVSSGTERPVSWSGKVEWVRRHLGHLGFKRLELYGHTIAKGAKPGDMMVAERRQGTQHWEAAGGRWFNWIMHRDPAVLTAQTELLRSWLDEAASKP